MFDLESVTKKLKDPITILAEVRGLFDAIIDKHSDFNVRLGTDAAIQHFPVFELAAVRIQIGDA